MDETATIPPELSAALGSDATDFVVQAQRRKPVRESMKGVIFGLIWLAFTSVFFLIFIAPVLVGGEVQFESNGVPVTASLANLQPLYLPGLLIGFFSLIGLVVIVASLWQLTRPGGWFVGTETHLLMFGNGRLRSIDWEQFSGDIILQKKADKGDLTLGLRTGQRVSRDKSGDGYIPDKIFITGIENAAQIERECRRRIKENDPT